MTSQCRPTTDTRDRLTHDAIVRIDEPPSYFAGPSSTHDLPSRVVLFRRHELPGGQHSYHHRYVLIYSVSCEGTVVVDGTSLRLCPGEAVLVFPHQFHHYASLTGARLTWLFITFEMDEPGGLEAVRFRTLPIGEAAHRILRRLVDLYPEMSSVTDAEEVVLLTALFLQHMRRSAESTPPGPPSVPARPHAALVEAAGAFVSGNLERPFTIEDVAQAVGCSESYLRAAFRVTVGTSFGRYLHQARLHRAEGLLVTSDASVTEIAEHCGYESVSSFSRAFKAFTGSTPSAWRKRGGDRSRDAVWPRAGAVRRHQDEGTEA